MKIWLKYLTGNHSHLLGLWGGNIRMYYPIWDFHFYGMNVKALRFN